MSKFFKIAVATVIFAAGTANAQLGAVMGALGAVNGVRHAVGQTSSGVSAVFKDLTRPTSAPDFIPADLEAERAVTPTVDLITDEDVKARYPDLKFCELRSSEGRVVIYTPEGSAFIKTSGSIVELRFVSNEIKSNWKDDPITRWERTVYPKTSFQLFHKFLTGQSKSTNLLLGIKHSPNFDHAKHFTIKIERNCTE